MGISRPPSDVKLSAIALVLVLTITSCAKIAGSGTGTGGGSGSGGTSNLVDAASDTRWDAAAPDVKGGINSSCDGPTATCNTTSCGNGVLNAPAETCDDGNRTGGDGCSPDCKTETDWI